MTDPTPRPDAAPDVLAAIERKALSLLAGATPGRIDVHRCDAESGTIDYQLQRAPGTPATVLGYATDSDGSSRAKADATLWAHAHEMTTAVVTLAAEVRRLTAALAPRSAADLAAIGARAAEYERAGVADVAGEVGARERWGSAAHAAAGDVWRVVLADGDVGACVPRDCEDGSWSAVVRWPDGAMSRADGSDAGQAVWRAAVERCEWLYGRDDVAAYVVEVLAPGEPSRAELTADLARLRAPLAGDLAAIERKALSLLAGTTPGRIDVHRCDADSGAIDYQLQRAPGTPATVLGYATDSDGSSRAKADATLWAHAHEMTTAVLTFAAEVRRLTTDLARLRAPADLAAIEGRAKAAREAVRPRRTCGECGAVDPVAHVIGGREFHAECPRAPSHSQYPIYVTERSLPRDETEALAADVPALLAHIAATRERHAAEVAAAAGQWRDRAVAALRARAENTRRFATEAMERSDDARASGYEHEAREADACAAIVGNVPVPSGSALAAEVAAARAEALREAAASEASELAARDAAMRGTLAAPSLATMRALHRAGGCWLVSYDDDDTGDPVVTIEYLDGARALAEKHGDNPVRWVAVDRCGRVCLPPQGDDADGAP